MSRVLDKILIANRGEIAVRVIRCCRELGIRSVAIYSDADRHALHVRLADEAWRVGPAPSRDSYLAIDNVIDAARRSGAQAVHPGYGFLAENAAFAAACEDAGLVFIGPAPRTIELLGEKTSARREAVAAGLSVVPGTLEPIGDPESIRREAQRIGYPLMLKAAAGGGGKGMRLVEAPEQLAAAVERARSEARGAFGDDRVYLERAIKAARHVEIQVLADGRGGAVHLFERECSVQRRHQKVLEESPSPLLTPELREHMGREALALVERTGYRGVGTLEFLVDSELNPWFLEMNTRLQVEHPVTELVTGVDLVEQQIRVARDEPLALRQEALAQRGHAIECRVYAEDPEHGFLPSPGRILALQAPAGPGVRDDSGVFAGYEVPVHYDPLISKLACHAATRAGAIARMRRAVAEYVLVGIRTTLPFFAWALEHPAFVSGRYDTSFIERHWRGRPELEPGELELAVATAAVAEHERRRRQRRPPQGQAADAGTPWWRAGQLERLGPGR